MIDIANIWRYNLIRGASHRPSEGACLFDAGMWLKYGKIGDDPPCACPIIRAYAVSLNDTLDDSQRQLLRPFILRVVGNKDEKAEYKRFRFLVINTIKTVLPLAFDGHYAQYARALRQLPDDAEFSVLRNIIRELRNTFNFGFYVNALDSTWNAIYSALSADDDQEFRLSAASSCAVVAMYVARAPIYYRAKPVPVPINLFEKPTSIITPPKIIIHDPVVEAVDAAINVLDGVLKIGKQSEEFDEGEVVAAVERFERARAEAV